MTSKSSFLGSLKENSKRRLWVWAVAVLLLVLILPLALAMRISLIYRQMDWLIESYGMARANEILKGNLIETVGAVLGPSEMLFAFASIFAVANAVQGFSWLYSRKKIDFYMGMPVKRSKRFVVIWLNGILIYLIPYILGLMISLLIAAGNHALDAGTTKMVIQTVFVNMLFYLGVYHMAMLAVMLTGNIVITGMGFLVFCLYEWVVRRVDFVYKAGNFRYFAGSFFDTSPVASPFVMYADIISEPTAMMAQGKLLVLLTVFAVIVGALSYVCYMKRPAEGAGKSIVFPIAKPIIKILLVIPMALLMGDLIANEVDYNPLYRTEGMWYVVLALILATILGSAVIQVLYEFDIKGALHQKRHILISGVFVALFFIIYRYDLLHYDSYIPDPEKVESIAFYPSNYETIDYNNMWIDENGTVSGLDYVDRYMYLENAEDVCDLVRYSMDKYDRAFPKGKEKEYDDNADEYWNTATVIYRMKSGKEVVRRLWTDMNDKQVGDYLDRIIGSPEFKEGYLIGDSDRLSQMIGQSGEYRINAYYGNLVYEQKLRETEILELLECYQADLEKFTFSSVKESTPKGVITVTFEREISNGYYAKSTMSTEITLSIHPFYDQSIACLKKFGYYMDRQIDVEDIDRIYVTNQNSEAYQEIREMQKASEGTDEVLADWPEAAAVAEPRAAVTREYGNYDIDTRGYADYTSREDIEKLADYVYASEMLSYRWDGGAAYDPDYSVLVYFKADSEMNRKYGATAYYKFREGNVPDFVQEDTAYHMPE